jgi:hypothetical protein
MRLVVAGGARVPVQRAWRSKVGSQPGLPAIGGVRATAVVEAPAVGGHLELFVDGRMNRSWCVEPCDRRRGRITGGGGSSGRNP